MDHDRSSREVQMQDRPPRKEDLPAELVQIVELLRKIHPQYPDVVSQLRKEAGIQNRGCGPSSYALAIMMEWVSGLPVDASYSSSVSNDDGIHIVFGMEQEGMHWIDHAWIEATCSGITILVSHESDPRSVAASFRVAAIRSQMLDDSYQDMGLRRISAGQLHLLGISQEQLRLLEKVIEEINEGRAPENYLFWWQCMMNRLDWRKE